MMQNEQMNDPLDGESKLPSSLVCAIRRVRVKTASPVSVKHLIDSVTHLGLKDGNRPIANLCCPRWSQTAISIAGSIALLISLKVWTSCNTSSYYDPSNVDLALPLSLYPVTSPVRLISFVEVGYLQVEEDLDRAEAKVESMSEGITLAIVRRDVMQTLEEFYNWSRE